MWGMFKEVPVSLQGMVIAWIVMKYLSINRFCLWDTVNIKSVLKAFKVGFQGSKDHFRFQQVSEIVTIF